MQSALRTRLLDAQAVKAKVKRRVDWDIRPKAKGLPAITLELASDPRPQHMGGLQGLRRTLVQVDCWSMDKREVVELRELVITTLLPAATVGGTKFSRSFVEVVRDTFERTDEGIVRRSMIRLAVWHSA